MLRANPDAWSVAGVSRCLRSLVQSSNVEAVLADAKAKGTPSGLIDFRERVSAEAPSARACVHKNLAA